MCFIILQNEKTHFQAIKTRSSKSRKIDIFPKGLTHGFAQKLAIFLSFFFQAIQARKMCFMIFQNEKTHFQAIKTRSSKRRKIDIFAKGLTHSFAQKLAIFHVFFQENIGQENVFYDILERKKALLGNKNKKFKQSKNGHFSKGVNRWFCSKIRHFSNFLSQAILARKMCFMIFQNEKTYFQAIKTRSSKSGKIDIFPKGLPHGFVKNLVILRIFFLGNIGQENVFHDILERKNAFLGNKNKKF